MMKLGGEVSRFAQASCRGPSPRRGQDLAEGLAAIAEALALASNGGCIRGQGVLHTYERRSSVTIGAGIVIIGRKRIS